jgi:hypothetical protein
MEDGRLKSRKQKLGNSEHRMNSREQGARSRVDRDF